MSVEKSKNVVITKKGREKLVKARAGALTLPKITGMAFGSGGVNESGTVIAPTESQAKLTKELYRKEIDTYSFPNDNLQIRVYPYRKRTCRRRNQRDRTVRCRW